MSDPTFTAPPPSPARLTDTPANFISKADAFVAWFATLYSELVTFVTWCAAQVSAVSANTAAVAASASAAALSATAAVNSVTLVATSSTSTSLTAAAKSISWAESGRTFVNGARAVMVRQSDPAAWMSGVLSSVDNTAKTATLTTDTVNGSGGPYTDWILIHEVLFSLRGATTAQTRAGTSSTVAVTPASQLAAAAFQTLTAGTNIAWDIASGANATVTLAGAANNMSAPSNGFDGCTISLELTQDGTGNRTITAWNSVFDWGASGTPTLSTGAGKVDFAFGVYSSRTGKWHMNFRKAA